MMKINIILPYKEKFDKFKSSAVSNTIINNLKQSKFKKQVSIYGQYVENPMSPENFVGIKPPLLPFFSKNMHVAKIMCSKILKEKNTINIIEIHNRPYLIDYIYKKIRSGHISIFFHNNPLEMNGSKSIEERKKILDKVSFVFCVSKFVKSKFLKGISCHKNKVIVLYNGVERNIKYFPKKYKEIIFVGRLVQEKGVQLYVKTIKKLYNKFPEYKFFLIGSSHLGGDERQSNFAKKIIKEYKDIGERAVYYGFTSNSKVQKFMKRASLIVVPSIWDEPFGLVVAEAMSNGIAVITSNVGGIPEVIGKNGVVINNINETKLFKNILGVLSDTSQMQKLQKLSWKNFSHSNIKSSNTLDMYRNKIVISSSY